MTGNDIYPRGDDSLLALASVTSLWGVAIQGVLFGELSELIFYLYEASIALQEKVDACNTALIHLNLPEEIRKPCITYIRGVNEV